MSLHEVSVTTDKLLHAVCVLLASMRMTRPCQDQVIVQVLQRGEVRSAQCGLWVSLESWAMGCWPVSTYGKGTGVIKVI